MKRGDMMAKNSFRRNTWRQHGRLIDTINFILCILILVSGIILMIDVRKYMFMFPVIFLLAAVMNGCLGVKKYKMDEYAGCILLFIGAVILLGFSVFSLIIVL